MRCIGVSIWPGEIALQLILCGPNSRAELRVIETTAFARSIFVAARNCARLRRRRCGVDDPASAAAGDSRLADRAVEEEGGLQADVTCRSHSASETSSSRLTLEHGDQASDGPEAAERLDRVSHEARDDGDVGELERIARCRSGLPSAATADTTSSSLRSARHPGSCGGPRGRRGVGRCRPEHPSITQ
jgi:hypothetical protein